MPSHIFTRVGYWSQSVDSNATAAKLAKAAREGDDQLHASDYMVYAYLQLGRDREARQIIDEMIPSMATIQTGTPAPLHWPRAPRATS